MPRPAAKKTDCSSKEAISTSVARQINANLAAWFQEFKRPLKFRETTDPYKIMVSEFMLQQTTVATVEPYYARFMHRFPSVESLAAATEDEVMNLWAGLGYYRRSRQLHASARMVVELHKGIFPSTVSELQKLPGFGRYTAGAVVSQAFDLPGAIVEANTVRVFARLAGVQGMTGDPQFMKALWKVSEELVCHADSPRIFNQAAMELGAIICRPQPLCDMCPVQQHCVACRCGVANTIVQPRPRPETVAVNVLCAAIRDEAGRYFIKRIPKGQWHAGMWEFPTQRSASEYAGPDAAAEFFKLLVGFAPQNVTLLTTLHYQVTRHKVICHVFHCQIKKWKSNNLHAESNVQFLNLKEISALPMGSAQKKLLLLLTERNTLENL